MTRETATDFRHSIGDSLYDLFTPYDKGAQETIRHPIVKRTAKYVWVKHQLARDEGHLMRFSIAALESKGWAYNRANRVLLYTRPLPHWPLMPAEVRPWQPSAITGGTQ